MFPLLSNDSAESVRNFLNAVLPEITAEWWIKSVIPNLSFQQQRMVEERGIFNLAGLDLAALLRIFDKNWYDISQKKNLTNEVRSWTREMQFIRNKWAHAGGNPPDAEDLYRDLDTLQRFLGALSADSELIAKVKERKQLCLTPAREEPAVSVTPSPAIDTLPPLSATGYSPGDMVYLKADPSTVGAVIQAIPGSPENRYLVFVGTKPTQYYESQLAKLDTADSKSAEPVELDTFHANLTALQLQHPGLANLYSLHAARVDYIPYQFKPVMKLIRSDRPRILIADEVGVGKTIEAGLILRELQARSDISTVLIICPRPLVTENKWRNEMKRFDEEFVHMDGVSLRSCIDETDKEGSWQARYNKAIIPFSLFNDELLHGSKEKGKKRLGLLDLDPLPQFDLVIVDEAHHLRNPDTCLYRGVEYFCANANAVVFLSATPVQLGSSDLFVLLNLLRPDLIRDPAVFQQMSEPNAYINRCIDLARGGTLDWQLEAIDLFTAAGQTSWGTAILSNNPDFQRLYDLLGDHELTAEERITFVREVEQLHTFASIINRTRRRDIGTFLVTRKPETVEIPFTPSQQCLHDNLLEVQATILTQIHGDRNLLFFMTTIRRQAASCLYGLAPFLKEILTRKIDLLEFDEIDADGIDDNFAATAIQSKIQEIITQAEQLDENDPKLEALLKIISDKQQLANNKILLFSSFRHTLAYLLKHLQAVGLRVGYIHGGTPDDERRAQRNRFELKREEADALDILLSSEIGCEGLDYQFCDCMVNYDLPWNPMRIEQRIGRIDRYGQKSDTVAIYNLITPGTVDADIYYRCLDRIGVFKATIGGNEEIIGNLTSKIKAVAENLTMTEEERKARLQQIADNEIRILQEQADLEEKQADLFGLRLPGKNDEDVKSAESFWLTPDSLQRLVTKYLEKVSGGQRDHILGDKPLKTLRLSQEIRDALLTDYRNTTHKTSPLYREWEKWLKGGNQHLTITFDAKCAAENRDATFLTPIHPLALQASAAHASEQKLCTIFRVKDDSLPSGTYPFTVYQWQKKGIREDVAFIPVCADPAVSAAFFSLLERGEMMDADSVAIPEQCVFDDLDSHHHGQWLAARLEHVARNNELLSYRRESLKTSHTSRMMVLNGKVDSAKDVKIKRMYASQVTSTEADYARHMVELEQAGQRADILAQPVAYGVVVVV